MEQYAVFFSEHDICRVITFSHTKVCALSEVRFQLLSRPSCMHTEEVDVLY